MDTNVNPTLNANFDLEFLMALLSIFITGFIAFYLGVPYVVRAFL